jgi:dodecin
LAIAGCFSLLIIQKALSYPFKLILNSKTTKMAIVKVIEVIASSEKSFDDAVKQAVKETSRTIRNIDSVWVKDMKAHVKDGKIKSYGVICKVSFRVGKDKDEKKGKDKEVKNE